MPLRGFLTCRLCGGKLTGSASKGKLQRYFYYHCQPGCKERFRADQANEEIVKELQKISVYKEALQLYRIILEKELKKSNKEVGVGNRKIIDEINKHKDRISTAETLMLDNQMELWEYKIIKTKYEDKIRGLETEMQSAITRPADYKEYLDFGFNILLQVDGVYATGSPFLKRQVLCSMYAENLIFDKNKYRTPVYHETLSLILNTVKGLSENGKGQNPQKSVLSSQVAPRVEDSNQFLQDMRELATIPDNT